MRFQLTFVFSCTKKKRFVIDFMVCQDENEKDESDSDCMNLASGHLITRKVAMMIPSHLTLYVAG